MTAFDELLADPVTALGYGMLVDQKNPVKAGFDAMLKAQLYARQNKRADLREKLLEKQLERADRPNVSYQFNPVTGELVTIDKDTGVIGSPQYSDAPRPAEPSGTMPQPMDDFSVPSHLNPRLKQRYREKMMDAQIEQQYPKPPSGYRYNDVGEVEPIPGSKESVELEKGLKLKDQALRIVDQILGVDGQGNITNQDAIERAVGPISASGYVPTVRGSTADIEADIGQLRSILTAENLGLMTGVLSETDLKVIADIGAGGLNMKRSDGGFINELVKLRQSLTKEAGSVPNVQAADNDSGWSIRELP